MVKPHIDEDVIRRKFESLAPALNEKTWRLALGAEAKAIGYGGISVVSRATGVTRNTISRGMKELWRKFADSFQEEIRNIGKIKVQCSFPPGIFPHRNIDEFESLTCCSGAFSKMSIECNGDIFPCSMVHDRTGRMGEPT